MHDLCLADPGHNRCLAQVQTAVIWVIALLARQVLDNCCWCCLVQPQNALLYDYADDDGCGAGKTILPTLRRRVSTQPSLLRHRDFDIIHTPPGHCFDGA